MSDRRTQAQEPVLAEGVPEQTLWQRTPPAGRAAILRLLDRLIQKIPGAIVRMTPEERAERIQERKQQILREAGL